jgi:hypothetical protein
MNSSLHPTWRGSGSSRRRFLRLMRLSFLLPFVAFKSAPAYPTKPVVDVSALGALHLLPSGEAKKVALIEGREGSPPPERWYILVNDAKDENGLHEYVVAGGELVASRHISQFAEILRPAEVSKRRSSGRCAKRWRAIWRMSLHDAPARCFSTRKRPSEWRRASPHYWRRNWTKTKHGGPLRSRSSHNWRRDLWRGAKTRRSSVEQASKPLLLQAQRAFGRG